MEHCVPLATRPRRDAILHAIAEHDNGWAEEDAAPRVNPATGQVFDFVTAPASVRQIVWPRGVARLAGDPWAAALVAQHAITVYDRFRPESEWAPFFAEMEAARDEMLRASGLPPRRSPGRLRVRAARGFDLADLLHRLDRRAAVRRVGRPALRRTRRRHARRVWRD